MLLETQSKSAGTTEEASPDSRTEETERTSGQVADLELDQVFEILKNQRRRVVLRYLNEHEGPIDLGELAEHVAAVENDVSVSAISSDQRKRVYVGLYQCHLPKMDDMDIVSFNKNRGRISLGPNADKLDPYLQPPSNERDWYRYYTAVAGLGGLMLAVAVASGTTGWLPVGLGLVVAALATTSVYHTYETRRR
jgi:hypothetical protein